MGWTKRPYRNFLSQSLVVVGGLLVVLVGVLMISTARVQASNAPTQFVVPDTTLTIDGFASPGALVQFFDDGALIGTTVAKQDGYYRKRFNAITAGLHQISIGYQDSDGRESDAVKDTVNVTARTNTSLRFFLPPTISINPLSTTEGSIVTFRGSTIPNAIVEIPLDGHGYAIKPRSGPDGRWAIAIGTNGYAAGKHIVIAQSLAGLKRSYPTLPNSFEIVSLKSPATQDSSLPADLGPPIITSPRMSPDLPYSTTEQHISISGRGEPLSQLVLYKDGAPIGSTFVTPNGDWQFPVKLQASRHEFRAVQCLEKTCSDYSNLLIVEYQGSSTECMLFSFRLQEYRFWDIPVGGGVDIQLLDLQGIPPYEIALDWGDGTQEKLHHDFNTSLKLHHVFHTKGQFNGTVTIVDQKGCQHQRYFSTNTASGNRFLFPWWWLAVIPAAWITYILVSWQRRKVS